MEKNVAIVDLEEYTSLIKENEKNKQTIIMLEKELEEIKDSENKVYDNIFTKIYNSCSYRFEKLLENINDTYYRKLIIEEFRDYGFNSDDFINKQIDIMVNILKKEKEINDEENN